jgi:hypothetical protein
MRTEFNTYEYHQATNAPQIDTSQRISVSTGVNPCVNPRVYLCVIVCQFTLGMLPLLYGPVAKTIERDAGQPLRAAQSKGVGGDSLTGRRDALSTIYRPKYPTNYPLLP